MLDLSQSIIGAFFLVFFGAMFFFSEFLVKARGIAGLIGVVLLTWYFYGQSENGGIWMIVFAIIGAVFIILDGKLLQDGTLAGLGLLMLLIGLVIPTGSVTFGLIVAVGWITGLLLSFLSLKILPKRDMWERIVLRDSLTKEEGYRSVSDKHLQLVGKTGVTLTDMRPSGTIEIDHQPYSADSGGQWISKGTPVRVVAVDGTKILIEPIREETEEKGD